MSLVFRVMSYNTLGMLRFNPESRDKRLEYLHNKYNLFRTPITPKYISQPLHQSVRVHNRIIFLAATVHRIKYNMFANEVRPYHTLIE